MKAAIFLLLVISAGVGFPLLFEQDAGFVVISWQSWTARMSLASFVLFAVVSFAVLFIGLRILGWIWDLPHRLRVRNALRKQNKAHVSLGIGCLQLLQQRWDSAEKNVLKSPQFSVLPAMHYIAAAFSAYRRGESVRAADYLDEAKPFLDGNEAEIYLFQAQMLQQQGLLVLAVEKAQQSLQRAPQEHATLLLLNALYLQLADWAALKELLPQLRKNALLSNETCTQLEVRIQAHLKSDSESN